MMQRANRPGCTRLYYFNTDLDVRVGDRITYRGLFGRTRSGVVTYIPTETPLPSDDIPEWVFTLDNGFACSALFAPDQAQPGPRFRFLSRGPRDFESLSPDQLEAAEATTPSSVASLLGCLGVTVLVALLISVVVVLFKEYVR